MNEQIIVPIYIIGLNRTCEFSIPAQMSVRTALILIQKILQEECHGTLQPTREKLYLIKAQSGKIINETISLQQAGIMDGEKLILA